MYYSNNNYYTKENIIKVIENILLSYLSSQQSQLPVDRAKGVCGLRTRPVIMIQTISVKHTAELLNIIILIPTVLILLSYIIIFLYFLINYTL